MFHSVNFEQATTIAILNNVVLIWQRSLDLSLHNELGDKQNRIKLCSSWT